MTPASLAQIPGELGWAGRKRDVQCLEPVYFAQEGPQPCPTLAPCLSCAAMHPHLEELQLSGVRSKELVALSESISRDANWM